jgi:hypothetical protein
MRKGPASCIYVVRALGFFAIETNPFWRGLLIVSFRNHILRRRDVPHGERVVLGK